MTAFHMMGAAEMLDAMAAGRATSEAIVSACLDRIEARDGATNAFVEVRRDAALAAARDADLRRMSGDRSPLLGVPYAIKDIFDVEGWATSANCHALRGRVAAEDSACAEAMANSGAVLLGKTVTHELAWGGPPAGTPFPAARNPWDLSRDTGGSSSGNGAALAARYVPLAIGSDSGGSIRQPSAFCGVVGLKPTFGRVSRAGVVPLAPSLDHCGPMARSVRDCAIVLQAIAGFDPKDFGSQRFTRSDFCSCIGTSVEGLRIGWARSFYDYAAEPEVVRAMEEAAAAFAALGCSVGTVTPPPVDEFVACGRLITLAEASTMHRRDFDAHPEAFGHWTRGRLSAGKRVLANDYIQALRIRQVLSARVDSIFDRCDAVVTAGARTAAWPLAEDGEDGYWRSRTEVAFNITGHPVISIPIKLSSEGLPLGIQIAGRIGQEAALIGIASALESHVAFREAPRGLD